MNNNFLNIFKSAVKIKIKGKNIERFIHKLIALKIELLEINYLNYKEVEIKIYKKDYPKLLKIKTIYETELINSYGMIKIKKIIKTNQIMITFVILGLILLFFLSKMIFDIKVVHTNKDIRTLLINALNDEGVSKYHFKKSYNQIQNIKQKILKKYKQQIEWLEIEEIGTKYVIRLETRKINKTKIDEKPQNVVAKKQAIIKKIEAQSGEIIKNVNDYVNKGDVIISGSINLNEDLKDIIHSEGKVYGEVWYQVTTEYPMHYKETKLKNNKKNVYVIKILNKEIELTMKKFKEKKVKEKTILRHNLLPISFVKQNQQQIETIDKNYTEKEALKIVSSLAREKIESKLNDKEYIIKQKNLKITVKNSKIIVRSFFSVYEDITDYSVLEEVGEDNV